MIASRKDSYAAATVKALKPHHLEFSPSENISALFRTSPQNATAIYVVPVRSRTNYKKTEAGVRAERRLVAYTDPCLPQSGYPPCSADTAFNHPLHDLAA